MNDADRMEWVENDENLYRWWLRTGMRGAEFVRRWRAEIDDYVEVKYGE